MRTVRYENVATKEITSNYEVAKSWGNYRMFLEDDHESAKRGRATRARIEARRKAR